MPDYVICLEDGRKFKSLKRHLRTAYNLTPDQYRAKWGLPSDYPMVAPAYAKARSALAHKMGLGSKRRKSAKNRPGARRTLNRLFLICSIHPATVARERRSGRRGR